MVCESRASGTPRGHQLWPHGLLRSTDGRAMNAVHGRDATWAHTQPSAVVKVVGRGASNYSYLSTVIGSTRAARRAGM
jgi:hypothetical protein